MNTLKANQKGFTMVELMITVTVIAILTTVAVPAYNDYVIRGKLQEATSALSAGRVQLEQFYQDNRTYVGALCTAAGTNCLRQQQTLLIIVVGQLTLLTPLQQLV